MSVNKCTNIDIGVVFFLIWDTMDSLSHWTCSFLQFFGVCEIVLVLSTTLLYLKCVHRFYCLKGTILCPSQNTLPFSFLSIDATICIYKKTHNIVQMFLPYLVQRQNWFCLTCLQTFVEQIIYFNQLYLFNSWILYFQFQTILL